MKIGLYSPYFDGFGGGEVYMLTLASHWSKKHNVSIFWDDARVVQESQKRFGLDLSRIKTEPNVFKNGSLFTKLMRSKEFDCILFLSDGSVPLSFASHNILHFQIPFAKVNSNALKRFDTVVCNSLFTKQYLDPRMGNNAVVIYPPVKPVVGKKVHKEKIILSVGRFTSVHEAKKQSVMIETFITMEKHIKDWELVLVGGLLESDLQYFKKLQKLILGHRITLKENITYEELMEAYNKSSFYWHAAGFGEEDPQFAEHFGISTVEAMSAGCVPLVYAGGGQVEIVNDTCGRLWRTPDELSAATLEFLKNRALFESAQNNAIAIAKKFSDAEFANNFDQLLSTYEKR